LHELERVPAVNVQRNRTSRSKDIPARHAGFAVLAAIALPAAARRAQDGSSPVD
jgi:hypothetical protein